MTEQLFQLTPDSAITLQAQVREKLISAILDGHLPLDEAVPSPRKLAQQLGIARNTVMLAYEQLVAEGYLLAYERRGYFVNQNQNPAARQQAALPADERGDESDSVAWQVRFIATPSQQRNIVKPRDWQRYKYPFIYGQLDPDLFPAANWRECCRQALSTDSIRHWSRDYLDSDDPYLVEQLRTRVLPRRGVWAASSEILVTLGAQHALYLLADLLFKNKTIAIEEPGYPDARNIFAQCNAKLIGLPVDQQGVQVDQCKDAVDYVYVTPSHQAPTTATLSKARRHALLAQAGQHDFIIIEDDYDSELDYTEQPIAALKSLDRAGRVVYIGSLSKTLTPGLRLGYMVGPEELISEARALRRLMLRHPPTNNERALALFLSRGHYDSLVRRLRHAYKERWQTMDQALACHLPELKAVSGFGSSAFWLHGSAKLDSQQLQRAAAQHGVLIEPGGIFFMTEPVPKHYFRLGFSAIAVNRIEAGVKQLAALL